MGLLPIIHSQESYDNRKEKISNLTLIEQTLTEWQSRINKLTSPLFLHLKKQAKVTLLYFPLVLYAAFLFKEYLHWKDKERRKRKMNKKDVWQKAYLLPQCQLHRFLSDHNLVQLGNKNRCAWSVGWFLKGVLHLTASFWCFHPVTFLLS